MQMFEIIMAVFGVILTIVNLAGGVILKRIFKQVDDLNDDIKEEGHARMECQLMLKRELAEEVKQRNDDFRKLATDISEHPKWVDTKEFVKAMVTPIAESQRTLQTQIASNTSAINTLVQSVTALIAKIDNVSIRNTINEREI